MLTDTHCHILHNTYYSPEQIISSLQENNLKRIIINGYNYETNLDVIELIKSNGVYGALGIHPDNINEDVDKTLELIKNNINNEKIIAIGEIGLDYYHNESNKDEQNSLLTKLLDIAETNDLPVIIHCRNASDDLLRILKKYHLKGIIHCFSGSLELAKEYIKLGFKLGIGGVLTFKNCNLKNVLEKIHIRNIILETDSPYLSPEPLRGTPNEPANLNFIAKELAKIYSIDLITLSNELEKNFNELFRKK